MNVISMDRSSVSGSFRKVILMSMMLRSLLLSLLLLCCCGQAQADYRLGIGANASYLADSSTRAAFSGYLTQRLGQPVSLLQYSQEAALLQRLLDPLGLNFALLSPMALQNAPAGALVPLATAEGGGPATPALAVVAASSVPLEVRAQLATLLLAMSEEPKGAAILQRMAILRFLPWAETATGGETPSAAGSSPAAEVSPVPLSQSPVAPVSTPPADPESLLGVTSSAQSSELPVSLQADQLSFEQANQTYQASGQVELRQGGVTLQSDTLTWEPEKNLAHASGNVRVSDPSGNMHASAADYQLEAGVGRLEQGQVFLREKNFHLHGDVIEKLGEETYRVSDGTFTTCDGEVPSWKFGASRVDVTLGRYASARNVVFYLKDLPVLYLPYVIFPVKAERESGLLIPRTGYSRNRGTQLSLAYYQVLGVNMDATLFLDYLSELGVGKGLEYRYLLAGDNQGRLLGYHVGGTGGERNHMALDWTHLGTLPGQVRLSADVEYVNNREYFAEFGEVAEEYNKDKTESVVTASRSWGKNSLTGQLKYLKDLTQSNDLTLQRLPELRLTSVRQRLGESPFYLGFDSSATYFSRREGNTGERLNLRPAISGVFLPGDWLEVAPTLGYRQRLYWTDDGEATQGQMDFSTRFASRFARVYDMGGGRLSKLRHSIEPDLLYFYRPEVEQNDLPQFDALDDIPSANTFSLGVTNRLVGRLETVNGSAQYHEYASLRLSQEYDVEESRRDRLDPGDRRQPFSNLRGELVLRPNTWSLLDFDGRYDFSRGEQGWSQLGLLARVQDSRGNALDLDYRYQEQTSEYLQGRVVTSWLKPVYLSYLQRHAIDGSRTLEQYLELEFRAQCWSIFVSYRDRLEDQEYLVSFALTGLGRVAKFGGSLGAAE